VRRSRPSEARRRSVFVLGYFSAHEERDHWCRNGHILKGLASRTLIVEAASFFASSCSRYALSRWRVIQEQSGNCNASLPRTMFSTRGGEKCYRSDRDYTNFEGSSDWKPMPVEDAPASAVLLHCHRTYEMLMWYSHRRSR
jgi:hypothetical protein